MLSLFRKVTSTSTWIREPWSDALTVYVVAVAPVTAKRSTNHW